MLHFASELRRPNKALFALRDEASATRALLPLRSSVGLRGDCRDLAAREFDRRKAGQVDHAIEYARGAEAGRAGVIDQHHRGRGTAARHLKVADEAAAMVDNSRDRHRVGFGRGFLAEPS